MTPEGAFARAMADLIAQSRPAAIGLAVSGGGDSMALMQMAARAGLGTPLRVVTVDHGLRDGSADEARQVRREAAGLGLAHETLRWQGWTGRGNLQNTARHARRRLIGDWARRSGCALILTGHTLDDQAETLLMRLARGSGVDGLGGMAPLRRERDLFWGRPLLSVRRAALRHWLRQHGLGWIDDPSNDDARFDRVRARQLAGTLADLGLSAERLAGMGEHMRAARRVLDAAAGALAARAVRQAAGDLLIDRAALAGAEAETRHRLLAAALGWISGRSYRPRFAALADAAAAAGAGEARSLHGCLLRPERGTLRITREFRAVRDLPPAPVGQDWDGRWRLTGPDLPGGHVAALGPAGLAECAEWRASGVPRAALLSSPAVWQGDRLIAAPLAGAARGWCAELVRGRDDFAGWLISH